MAKDNSFDIMSECDMQEVDNAYNQAKKALSQRYDLKDTNSKLEFDKSAASFTVLAPSDFICGQVVDVLNSALVKRKIDLASVRWGKDEEAAGSMVRRQGSIIQGIEADIAKRISKDIKAQKFKAKVQIEGEKLRVSSPKRDTLQEVIAFVKEQDYGIPLQFGNYR